MDPTLEEPKIENCPVRTERHRLRRLQINRQRFTRYLSPKYHVHKFVEDIKHARHAIKIWSLETVSSESDLRKAIRGKLFGTYLGSSLVAGTGGPLGYAAQFVFNDYWKGYIFGILWANLAGLVGFQVIWALANKSFYRAHFAQAGPRLTALFQDLLPMQARSLLITVVLNLVMLPVVGLVIHGIEHFFPNAVKAVPVSFIATISEVILIQSTALRLLGDLFDRHSKVLAKKYSPASPVLE